MVKTASTEPDLSTVSDEDLYQQWDEAANAALEAKQRAKDLGDEVERRQLAADARTKVEAMTPGERDALVQAVQAVGIETSEEVNG